MLQQALDFRDESEALYALVKPLSDQEFRRETQFKGWTLNEILQHLHYFNYAAFLSLTDEDGILALLGKLRSATAAGGTIRSFTDEALDGLSGEALRETWRDYYMGMLDDFHRADPKARVKWAGPDMSVLSSITARLMETWAHAQAVYDLLGVERQDTDRIKNVVVIGNNTFGWTFQNRGLQPPGERPYLKLTAPSGAIWEFNEPDDGNCISGAATEFCQVVTQTRNVQDTALTVVGDVANEWMRLAQCFAGAPQDPPAPGARFRQS